MILVTDEHIELKIKYYEDEIKKAYFDLYTIFMSNEKNINNENLILLEDFIQITRKKIERLKNVD